MVRPAIERRLRRLERVWSRQTEDQGGGPAEQPTMAAVFAAASRELGESTGNPLETQGSDRWKELVDKARATAKGDSL